MMKFMAGVRKMPLFWQGWLGILMLINGVGPLFFLSEDVAVVTLVAMMAGGIAGGVLTQAQGFTKLLGLMHLPWIPMFVLQVLVLYQTNPEGSFKLWLIASAAVTFISLIIDILDVASYLRGNRTDLLKPG